MSGKKAGRETILTAHIFHWNLKGILFSWVVAVTLNLLLTERICRQESGQVLVSYAERRSWLHTASQHIGALCYLLQMLPVTASAGCWPPWFAKWVEDLQRWPCTTAAAHRRCWEGGRRQRVGCCIALGKLWLVFCPWELGRNGWDMQPGLCSWDVLLRIEATFRLFSVLGRCQAFTPPNSFDIKCVYGIACRALEVFNSRCSLKTML